MLSHRKARPSPTFDPADSSSHSFQGLRRHAILSDPLLPPPEPILRGHSPDQFLPSLERPSRLDPRQTRYSDIFHISREKIRRDIFTFSGCGARMDERGDADILDAQGGLQWKFEPMGAGMARWQRRAGDLRGKEGRVGLQRMEGLG